MSDKRKMDKDVAHKLEEFHKAAAVVAEEVLFVTWPAKILELQALIDSANFPSSPFHPSHAANSTDPTVYPPPTHSADSHGPETKKRKLDADESTNGVLTSGNDIRNACYPNLMHANKHIIKVHEIMKRECEQLAELIDKVKLWVNLSMPKIEDGDNFGVQIQEEVLNELHRSQESAYNLRDAARQNYANRAKLCSKIIKYPHVEDYVLTLKEHDEKQLYVARQNLHDLRNVYAILTDILHKNITKIRSPKGNNSSGLY
ncbi:proteasome activator pa28, REG alpha/beta subunit [Obba rivulosa]|uniref:Proteasome activator pa28, REG alpha/beta subunit n=1 Tax=Obba rivulosa TaxID=1052685 RepID=A0A8E2J7D4_9APHY|nr:proteasome activator pa28, REG alpha/beta subunit [Obba rivulosa]